MMAKSLAAWEKSINLDLRTRASGENRLQIGHRYSAELAEPGLMDRPGLS